MKLKTKMRQCLFALFIVFVLGLVLAAYMQPNFIVDFANRMILC